MRGTDPSMARCVGIAVPQVFSATFAIGCGLAALGGALGSPILPIEPYYGLKYLVLVLIVVAVGGLGSLRGSLYDAADWTSDSSSSGYSRAFLVRIEGGSEQSETRLGCRQTRWPSAWESFNRTSSNSKTVRSTTASSFARSGRQPTL